MPRTNPPTIKMLEWAKSISAATGIPLTEGLTSDFEICSQYLNEHKGNPAVQRTGGGGPTPKMLDWARSIAKALDIELSPAIEQSFELCSAFITDNKDKAIFPPSRKSVEYATSIANSKKLELPSNVLASARDLSKWIDTNK